MFLLREREINPCEKFQDPAGIQIQDLLNTSQTLLGHSMSNQHKKIPDLLDLDETWFLHRAC